MAEIAKRMGVCESGVFAIEATEGSSTINMKSMARMAEAMDCKVMYGIVPLGGKTFEEMAERRLWASVLGAPKPWSGDSENGKQRPGEDGNHESGFEVAPGERKKEQENAPHQGAGAKANHELQGRAEGWAGGTAAGGEPPDWTKR